jgi:hypothetical protein
MLECLFRSRRQDWLHIDTLDPTYTSFLGFSYFLGVRGICIMYHQVFIEARISNVTCLWDQEDAAYRFETDGDYHQME